MHSYLFVLSPPYCGSTVLWRLLATSPRVSAHPTEGQYLDEVKHIIWEGPTPWNPQKVIPWTEVKMDWERVWDMTKPILLEKSSPHIVWALDIEKVFDPAYFIVMMRNPYAFCEGRRRRHPGSHIKASAEFWAWCANYQIRNIQLLQRVMYFSTRISWKGHQRSAPKSWNSSPPWKTSISADLSMRARLRGMPSGRYVTSIRRRLPVCRQETSETSTRYLEQHGHLMSYFEYLYLGP